MAFFLARRDAAFAEGRFVDALSKEHVEMVEGLARQLIAKLPANVEFDDLVQVGLMGLNSAFGRFDPEREVTFRTFATARVKGAMLDELRSNDYLSRSVRRTQKLIHRTIHKLQNELGREPTDSEVAKDLGLSLANYQHRAARAFDAVQVSMEDLAIESGDVEQFVERRVRDDDSNNPMRRLEDRRQREALLASIDLLPERERTLMAMYYDDDRTYREIGEVLGVTESRVSQMHAEAVVRLRRMLRDY